MSDQVALVTGSSRGIGFSAALELARVGYNIALNARAPSSQMDRAAKVIEAEGVKVYEACFDISKIEEHNMQLNAIEEKLGKLTTLVNNAGVGVMSRGDPLDVNLDSFERCMNINAKGLFFLTQKFSKKLLSRERSSDLNYCIINVTSSNSVAVAASRGEYCASKAAASMISKVFAVRLGAENIPVFDVQPGLIETEMTKAVIDIYKQKAANGLCVMPRVGKPEELGIVISSLATGKIPYTTGQVISVDGGMLLPRF
ncbi:3-ketoacyl-ACP reductase [Amylibacter sp.]|nr:3-ketoacyl-ACP reductase [Amylibacter sp.]